MTPPSATFTDAAWSTPQSTSICAYLLLRAAQCDALELLVARYFIEQMAVRVEGVAQAVLGSTPAAIDALQTLGRD